MMPIVFLPMVRSGRLRILTQTLPSTLRSGRLQKQDRRGTTVNQQRTVLCVYGVKRAIVGDEHNIFDYPTNTVVPY